MASPPIAALAAAIAAVQETVASVPSISGAPAATLAMLQGQIATAQGFAAQVLSYYDNALAIAGSSANFASGTAPAVMIANVNNLLAANAGINFALDCAVKLGRLAANVAQIVSPPGALCDLSHLYGDDLAVTPTGDIAVVSGWMRTVQRVIRRLCTPATTPGAGSGNITVAPGDDLYRLAAEQYGDATAWGLIAAANGLSDPLIQADQVLVIPPYNAGRANDGILPVPGSTS